MPQAITGTMLTLDFCLAGGTVIEVPAVSSRYRRLPPAAGDKVFTEGIKCLRHTVVAVPAAVAGMLRLCVNQA